jgi:glc operon protein GlcG
MTPRSTFLLSLALLTSALSGGAASAQSLTLERAKQIAAAASAEAKRLSAPGGAIAITDAGGHLVYLERLDGTFPAAAAVSAEKARTAAVFQKRTADFEDAIKAGRNALLGVDVMTPLQGGVPIRIGNAVVGAIGVSGAASAAQDTEIAEAAVAAAEKE